MKAFVNLVGVLSLSPVRRMPLPLWAGKAAFLPCGPAVARPFEGAVARMSGQILVIDDVATNRISLRVRLATAYYSVHLAESGAEGIQKALEVRPDVILLDVMMPDMDGFETCRRLKAHPDSAHIPVIMVTALNTPEERIEGLEAGADDFLTKPVNDIALFAMVRSLMRTKLVLDELRIREETMRELGLDNPAKNEDLFADWEGHVLMIGQSDAVARGWSDAIGDRLPLRYTIVASTEAAHDVCSQDRPDAIVIGRRVGVSDDGVRLVSTLRSQPDMRKCAIIFAVEPDDFESAAQVLDMGANDYIVTPVNGAELAARLRSQLKRKLYSDRLRASMSDGLRMAMVDPLTGLYNRRYVTRHLDTIMRDAHASGYSFATMMLDLDRFKHINDTYGHDSGDIVLREFARRLGDNVRSMDLVARLGGEEFFVAMPDVDPDVACEIAERVRASVADPGFVLPGTDLPYTVTVSIGVAMSRSDDLDAEGVIRRADEALYSSKANGRNRVTLLAA